MSKAIRKANLSSVNFVTNIPSIASDLPVGARLHQFGENWEVLGASPKVVTVHRGLPFWLRTNHVTNCHKLLYKSPQEPLLDGGIVSAGEQNAVEPIATQKSLDF